jgi:hypothetical protein
MDTVSEAPLLVADPALLVTCTLYVPALAVVTPVSESVEPVAPGIAAPFKYH